jgi:hypothetical protein
MTLEINHLLRLNVEVAEKIAVVTFRITARACVVHGSD